MQEFIRKHGVTKCPPCFSKELKEYGIRSQEKESAKTQVRSDQGKQRWRNRTRKE